MHPQLEAAVNRKMAHLLLHHKIHQPTKTLFRKMSHLLRQLTQFLDKKAMISTLKAKTQTQFPFTPQSFYLSLSPSEVSELQLPSLFFFFRKKEGHRNPWNELFICHNDVVYFMRVCLIK